MADIIQLRGSPHEQTQALLPWYVNETLEAEERALVDEHLAECAECRSDLDGEQALAREVASLPVDAERGWAALAEKLDHAPVPANDLGPVRLLRRRISVGWAAASQLAVAAALLLAVYVGRPGTPDPTIQVADAGLSHPAYITLGSNGPVPSGNVVVLFDPQTTVKDIRGSLARFDARIVGGPTASGAYILHVPNARRQQALDALRSTDRVLLAEPIDSEAGQ